MMDLNRLALLDSDLHRRGSVCNKLFHWGFSVEPFENPAELTSYASGKAVLLVHDSGSTIEDILRDMRLTIEWVPVIAYLEEPSIHRVTRAMRLGALDYLAFPFTQADLKEICSNNRLGVARSRWQKEARAKKRVLCLSKRETEVLANMAEGLSNKRIGARLDISPRTVEIHRANMLNKLEVRHSAEAIRIAFEADLV